MIARVWLAARLKKGAFVGLLAAAAACASKEKAMIGFRDVSPRGYSQRVEWPTAHGTMVFISGQVPVDEKGEIVGKGNLEEQTEQVFKNIKAQVEKAGGTMGDVVKIDCYFKDISAIAAFRAARDKYVNLDRPPASTAMQVQQLVNPDFLIEIDAIAVVGVRPETR